MKQWSQHRADQHQFEPALPDDAPAEPLEHRAAFAAISRIGLRAGGLAAVGIGGLRPQADEVEHVDRAWPVIVPELRKNFLGWIDMSHAMLPVFYVRDPPLTTRCRTS